MNKRVLSMLTKLAIENPGLQNRFKLSAGVVYKKNLISTGVNSYKSHPMMKGPGYNPEQIFMHAEVDAIRNALRLIPQQEMEKTELYVVRVRRPCGNTKKWVYGMAKPCAGCMMTIASFNISKIFWTTDELEIDNNFII